MYKDNRGIKVYQTYAGNRSIPQIRMQGKWLRELGFDAGDRINVECRAGELVITKRGEPIVEAGMSMT